MRDESLLALAVRVYNTPEHVPIRTCLGCGGGYDLADGRHVYAICSPRGVELLLGDERVTWAQVERATPKQDGLGLA